MKICFDGSPFFQPPSCMCSAWNGLKFLNVVYICIFVHKSYCAGIFHTTPLKINQFDGIGEEKKKTIVTSSPGSLPSPKMHPRMGMEKRVIRESNPKKQAATNDEGEIYIMRGVEMHVYFLKFCPRCTLQKVDYFEFC